MMVRPRRRYSTWRPWLALGCVVAISRASLCPVVAVDAPPAKWQSPAHLPPVELMARLAFAESSGRPDAVSHAGAVGLCQITPDLARRIGADPARLTDPHYNLSVASRWLGRLIRRYGVDGALRAYLCGETRRHLWYTAEADEYVRRILQ